MTPDGTLPGFLERGRIGTFTTLLALLFLLVLVPALLPDGPILRWGSSLAFAGAMLAAIRAVSDRRRVITIAWAILVPVIVLRWLATPEQAFLALPGRIGAIAFLLLVVVGISRYVLAARVVDWNVISAALCIYLILGVIWGEAYTAVTLLDPAAFSMPEVVSAVASRSGEAEILTYFSFVTLTTLGYGDVAPVSSTARSLVVLEAVVGQIFLVTLVARLVSMHVMNDTARLDTGPREPVD